MAISLLHDSNVMSCTKKNHVLPKYSCVLMKIEPQKHIHTYIYEHADMVISLNDLKQIVQPLNGNVEVQTREALRSQLAQRALTPLWSLEAIQSRMKTCILCLSFMFISLTLAQTPGRLCLSNLPQSYSSLKTQK